MPSDNEPSDNEEFVENLSGQELLEAYKYALKVKHREEFEE